MILTLMCLSIGHPKTSNFPSVPNGNLMVFRCPNTEGYSIKTYHPGGDPTLKLAKPPLEVQLSVYRPTLEPFSFNTYPPLEEIFISFRMVLVVCMYVCM